MDPTLEHRIRERAYEIWTATGCIDGQADAHWLAAERDVVAAIGSPAPEPQGSAKPRRRQAPARPRRTGASPA